MDDFFAKILMKGEYQNALNHSLIVYYINITSLFLYVFIGI